MPRAKRGFKRIRRVRRLQDQAEGFFLGRRTQYRRMVEAVRAAWAYQFEGRKKRKRDFRGLWITRISAAATECGLSYSAFVGALKKAKVDINRKMLSEIAISDPTAFSALVSQVKTHAPKA